MKPDEVAILSTAVQLCVSSGVWDVAISQMKEGFVYEEEEEKGEKERTNVGMDA